jgi:hypothetical protein
MSGWGCPHEINGTCDRLGGRTCDPGMKGCILYGRFRFSNGDKNRPPRKPPQRDDAKSDADPE